MSEDVAISCVGSLSPVVGAFSGVFLSPFSFPLHLFAGERTNNAGRILHTLGAISRESCIATRKAVERCRVLLSNTSWPQIVFSF